MNFAQINKAPAIAKESGDGKWKALISKEFDVSFARFEDSQCDDRFELTKCPLMRRLFRVSLF